MEWWQVYLFTRIDSVKCLLVGISIVSIVTFIAYFLVMIEQTELDDSKKITPRIKKYWSMVGPVAVVSLLLLIALPSQKDIAAIYLLPKLANSNFAKEAQKIPTDAAKLLRLKLESWITDIEPDKEKK